MQHWNYLYLIQHCLQSTSSDSLIKDCSFSCTTRICTVLIYLTGLHSICHVPYVTLSLFSFFFIVLQLSSFVYLYSLYVHMVKLYLSVFECLLSVFNVNCMHQGSESNAISILCMYCTCGRIDNKTLLDLLDLTWLLKVLKSPCCVPASGFILY